MHGWGPRTNRFDFSSDIDHDPNSGIFKVFFIYYCDSYRQPRISKNNEWEQECCLQFDVVYSSSILTRMALCFRFRRQIRHYHIHQRKDELSRTGRQYFLYVNDFSAPALQELLRHYTTHPLAPRCRPVPVAANDSALMDLKLTTAILDR